MVKLSISVSRRDRNRSTPGARRRLVLIIGYLLLPSVRPAAAQASEGQVSPLQTWRVTLPFRRGVELWARNPTADSVGLTQVEVSGCENILSGCGRTPLAVSLAPGDSARLLVVHPLDGNAAYGFRWSHAWSSAGLAPPAPVIDSTPLPAWAVPLLDARFRAAYRRQYDISPDLLEPDLDGDGEADLAFLVRDARGRRGIALLRHSRARPDVIGAGNRLGNGGDDFSWMDQWSVETGVGLGAPDRLYLARSESAAGLIRWTGTAYEWEQSGD